MGCDIDHEVLMAYLDGELAPIERGRIAEHIVACEACRDTVNALRAVSGALAKWTVPEPSTLPSARELLDRAAIDPAGAARPSAWRGVVLRWGAAAALAVVAATAAIVIVNRERSEPSGSVAQQTPAAPPEQSGASQPATGAAQQPSSPGSVVPPPPQPASPATPPTSNTPAARPEAPADAKEDRISNAATGAGAASQEEREADTDLAKAPPPAQEPMVEQPAPTAATPGAKDEARRANEGPASEKVEVAAGAPAPKPARTERKAVGGELTIKSTVLTIETRDVDAAVGAIQSAARDANGRASVGNSSGGRDKGRTVTLTVDVPAERFEEAVARIKRVGTVKGEMQSSRDVGEAIGSLDDTASDRKQRDALVDKARRATIRVTLREP